MIYELKVKDNEMNTSETKKKKEKKGRINTGKNKKSKFVRPIQLHLMNSQENPPRKEHRRK